MRKIETANKWLDVLARGATDEWDQCVSDNIRMEVPFMPGDLALPVEGIEPNRQRVSTFWQAWKWFEFYDIKLHTVADDSDLMFVQADSKAETHWGASYRNTYILRLRFRDGLIVEHVEFLNPLAVMTAFEGHL